MDIKELTTKIEEISWAEHVNFEVGDKYPEPEQGEFKIEEMLRQLGQQISPAMLDELESDFDGIEWSLRLSHFVVEDDSKKRAQRFINHKNKQIRLRASRLLATTK
ncbi:hypothetical protein G4Y79_03170 [Phototrophicus methaneseepsis]|uniref:Uncharacterized protein n=1 Tax=Phototrophicus methaneseepsis TaxID=2710758 RepID=A0A7S8IFB3_9CHLR|nr:hypothetical protein [Phototrophicus methaneseepsis]QPC83397.1 hypothetical protein G4Y79_03170 [Phototrophicus methaneseepsis]